MLKPADHFHGSDLEKIEQFYGISKKDIVSFGANVNPLGISGLLKESCPTGWMLFPPILTENIKSSVSPLEITVIQTAGI